jgi:hypothetical protein
MKAVWGRDKALRAVWDGIWVLGGNTVMGERDRLHTGGESCLLPTKMWMKYGFKGTGFSSNYQYSKHKYATNHLIWNG